MSINETPYALLLEDVQGHKEHLSDSSCVQSFEIVVIPKGSLLETLAPSEAKGIKEVYKFQANYSVCYSTSLLLASSEQLYKLTVKQRDLLLAVDVLTDRIKVFDKLSSVESLREGSEVYVSIDTISIPIKGVIRYIGELSGLDGTRFGVELMERRGEGDSDGCFQGQYCFKCAKKCAVFVSMDLLSDNEVAGAAKPSDEPVPPEKVHPVRISDYITFSDKHGHKHRGLVRWIGNDKSVQPDGTTIVGIEADKSLDLTGIPQHVTGCDCFSVTRQGSKVFLPVQYVRRESVHGHSNASNDQKDTPTKDHFHSNDLCAISPNPHNLKVGSVVQYDEQSGVIKWMGLLNGNEDKNLMAGLEMDEDIEDEVNDGWWAGVEHYTCTPKRGIFVDVTELLLYKGPRPRILPKDQNPHKLEMGSVVQYGDPPKIGVVKWIGTFQPNEKVLIAGLEMDEPVENATDGLIEGIKFFECSQGRGTFVRLSALQPRQRRVQNYTPPLRKPRHKLEVGSAVQCGKTPRYGTIKEMCFTKGEQLATVEWELGGCNKIRLSELQPDGRFIVDVNDTTGHSNRQKVIVPLWHKSCIVCIQEGLQALEAMLYDHAENKELSVVPPEKFDEHKHTDTKGIQGHHNSCYLDATLYGMFAFCDAFDVALLDVVTTSSEEQLVQKLLKNKIIYPLRVMGVVVQDSTQVFRTHLSDFQKRKGFASDEKDPEEFLNFLFKHILHADPFVQIRRPSGIEEEFLIQLFVEPLEGVSVVRTQQLLAKMFLEQNISFAKEPSKLLLQMPRYGKKFKSFQRIIPSLELDITELCETKNKQHCKCSKSNSSVCNDCSNEPDNKMLCDSSVSCDDNDPSRPSHRPHQLNHEFDIETGKLQLLSVLCIETSHYVCFTRATKNDWVFFDSMAERLDSGYNLPKVTVCTQLLQEYVYGEKNISKVPSKKLPELVRRFVEDAYMCIYIQSNHCIN